jgi:hypothetical protein
MRSSLRRTLALVFVFSCLARAASATAIPVGLLSFDENNGTFAFNVTNLTGLSAFPPDYPITTPLTITVSALTADVDGGGTLTVPGSAFETDPFGNVNCTKPGDAGSAGCNFAAYSLSSALLSGTFSPLSGLTGLPPGFVGIQGAFTATLLPSAGATLTVGDFVNIEATLVEPETGSPVPEPPTAILMEIGLFGLFARHKFNRISQLLARVGNRRSLAAILVPALLLVGQSPTSAQSLTPSANPSSGAAGVNSSYVTGSGFPAGTITSATVAFGTSCAAPSVASVPAGQIIAQGVLRRLQFLIPASLTPGTYQVWVSGTTGTATFNTLNTPSCSTITVTSSVKGTASVGAAIISGAVTLVDAGGHTVSGITASDGTFALPSGGLTPPYLLRVVLSRAAGSFPAGTTLYSVSGDPNVSTHLNVNVLTDAMLRTFYNAEGINPDDAFSNPADGNVPPSPAAVVGIANLFIPAVQLWTDLDGLTLTGDAPANGALNLITSPYAAFPPGVPPPPGSLDLLLHQIVSDTLNANGSVSALTINAGGTITETISPTTANDLITLTTTTTDSSNPGNGSAGSFSALALTNTLAPVIAGIQAALDAFRNIINTQGSALTGSDLLPIFSLSFLDDGLNRVESTNDTASELAGATFDTLQLVGIKSFDPATGIANPIVDVAISAGSDHVTSAGDDTLFVRNEGGTWLQYGNQRIGRFSANVTARTFQGAGNGGGVFVDADANVPAGSVTHVVVSGPTNNPALIWPGNPGPPTGSVTLNQGAQELQRGRLHDSFFALSNPLGSTFDAVNAKVPAGSQFVFVVSTPSSGTPQYVQPSNFFSTETIQFTSFNGGIIPAHANLSTVVGQTVSVTFTWPATFPLGEPLHLSGAIYDGDPNSPLSRTCNAGTGVVTLNSNHTGSGTITFPANMSPCGVASPIKFVQIFLEADGSHGEQSLAFLGTFPY